MITGPKYKFSRRQIVSYSVNTFFIGLICLFLFVPDAKSWVMKQMLTLGFFRPDVEVNPNKGKSTVPLTGLMVSDTKGNRISISDLKGKVVFINFWATWCPPCRAEMPALHNMYTALKGNKNFVFLFITEDEEIGKAVEYFKDNNYDLPLYVMAGSVQSEVYSGTLPTTLVIDKVGIVAYKHEGVANYNTEKFKKYLESLQ